MARATCCIEWNGEIQRQIPSALAISHSPVGFLRSLGFGSDLSQMPGERTITPVCDGWRPGRGFTPMVNWKADYCPARFPRGTRVEMDSSQSDAGGIGLRPDRLGARRRSRTMAK